MVFQQTPAYNKRGTAEQWIKEGKQAVKMPRLSCHRFRPNEVRLWLSVNGLQPGESLAVAGVAKEDRQLVADELAVKAGEDRFWFPCGRAKAALGRAETGSRRSQSWPVPAPLASLRMERMKKGPNGDGWIYTQQCQEAKTEIPVQTTKVSLSGSKTN